MSEPVRNLAQQEEYWRPQLEEVRRPAVSRNLADVCRDCGTEFILGARFCHLCGNRRSLPSSSLLWGLGTLHDRLGAGALVALFAGLVALAAALATGLVFTAETALDWETIQAWRAQWLLAGVAAFLAGLLLKRS